MIRLTDPDPHWQLALRGYHPPEWRHHLPATERQVAFLSRFDWRVPEETTRGQCAHVIWPHVSHANAEATTCSRASRPVA
jgi:hypothetical protein